MLVKDIIPVLNKDDAIAIIDQNGVAEIIQPRDLGYTLSPLLNKQLTQISRYRVDDYAEEDYVALRIAYDREVIE